MQTQTNTYIQIHTHIYDFSYMNIYDYTARRFAFLVPSFSITGYEFSMTQKLGEL